MDEKGLGSSIWATGFKQADGDWICAFCRFNNFSWRVDCFKCKRGKNDVLDVTDKRAYAKSLDTPKLGWSNIEVTNGNHPLRPSQVRKDDLDLPNTDGHTTGLAPLDRWKNGSRTRFDSPGMIPDSSGYSTGTSTPVDGLATSRWAPRSYDGKHKYTGPPQVWTRLAPAVQPHSRSQPSSRPPSPLDLGLPYEVQHYILAMMQRILEEACYDFASRWVPSMLQSNNWTCSEAVELSAWKKFIPGAIPSNALNLTYTNGSLESALAEAVKIRNSAVHRHLCDNRELRTMAARAQGLMEMFGDTSRKAKFARLRGELSVWDTSENKHAARAQLEMALREIGERDMDDMDWTPNSVSLQEIKADVVADIPTKVDVHAAIDYADEMEID